MRRDRVAQTLIVLVLLGFPVALIIAWAFELHAKEAKRTENISPDEPLPQWSKRKFAAVFATLALIAAALLAWQWLKPTTPSRLEANSPRRPFPKKSVAVLAFANLSDDKSNEPFADSVSEELLRVTRQGARVEGHSPHLSFSF